jgi:hypothetical protein
MATYFNKSLAGAPQQQGQHIDPEQALYDAAVAKLNAPRAPMFTPEQITQRRNDNERDYQIGLLAQLSGDQGLSNVGGQVFKQALAARKPTISERGSSDQITGEFTYDPDYMRQRDEAGAGAIGSRIAQRQATREENRTKEQARATERQRHDEAMAEMRRQSASNGQVGAFTPYGTGPEGQNVVTNSRTGVNYVVNIGANGQPQYTPYTGPATPKAAFEKNVATASEALQSAQRASNLLKRVEADPDAFGMGAAATAALPGWAQGYAAKAIGLTPQQMQSRAALIREAAQEINTLYGAALSAGENARAATFMPDAKDGPEAIIAKLIAARDWAASNAQMQGPAAVRAAGGRMGAGGASGGWDAPDAAPAPGGAPGGLSPAEQAELVALRKRLGK